MSRYGRYGNADQYGKLARPYRAPARSAFKAGTGVRTVKAAAAYASLYNAWRAGLINDFRLGERAADDKTVVWTVDGAEYAEKAYGEIAAAVAAKLAAAGIVSIEAGASWVGYPALTITYADGSTTTDGYDGVKGTFVRTAADLAVAA